MSSMSVNAAASNLPATAASTQADLKTIAAASTVSTQPSTKETIRKIADFVEKGDYKAAKPLFKEIPDTDPLKRIAETIVYLPCHRDIPNDAYSYSQYKAVRLKALAGDQSAMDMLRCWHMANYITRKTIYNPWGEYRRNDFLNKLQQDPTMTIGKERLIYNFSQSEIIQNGPEIKIILEYGKYKEYKFSCSKATKFLLFYKEIQALRIVIVQVELVDNRLKESQFICHEGKVKPCHPSRFLDEETCLKEGGDFDQSLAEKIVNFVKENTRLYSHATHNFSLLNSAWSPVNLLYGISKLFLKISHDPIFFKKSMDDVSTDTRPYLGLIDGKKNHNTLYNLTEKFSASEPIDNPLCPNPQIYKIEDGRVTITALANLDSQPQIASTAAQGQPAAVNGPENQFSLELRRDDWQDTLITFMHQTFGVVDRVNASYDFTDKFVQLKKMDERLLIFPYPYPTLPVEYQNEPRFSFEGNRWVRQQVYLEVACCTSISTPLSSDETAYKYGFKVVNHKNPKNGVKRSLCFQQPDSWYAIKADYLKRVFLQLHRGMVLDVVDIVNSFESYHFPTPKK